jgi:hypothetical protein
MILHYYCFDIKIHYRIIIVLMINCDKLYIYQQQQQEGDSMSKKIKVDIIHLEQFRQMLTTIENRPEIIRYFDQYILKQQQQDVTQLKQIIYSTMRASRNNGNVDEYERLFQLYQDFKNELISYDEAMEKL